MKTGDIKIRDTRVGSSITIKNVLSTYSDGTEEDSVRATFEGVMLFCAQMEKGGESINDFIKEMNDGK